MDLSTLWAFILTFAAFAYVVLDSFDLGIGIRFPTPSADRSGTRR